MKRRYVNRNCHTRVPKRKRPITFTYVELCPPEVTKFMTDWVQYLKDMPEVVMTLEDHFRDAAHSLKYGIILLNINQRIVRNERRKIPLGTFQRYKPSYEAEHALREMRENRQKIREALQRQRKLREIASTSTPVAA